MWDTWGFFYRKLFKEYGLTDNVASIRAVNIPPDVEQLLRRQGGGDVPRLTDEAMKAIEEDGADVIVLGSTTMHQAAAYLTEHLPCPLINPGPAAVAFAETHRAPRAQPLEARLPLARHAAGREAVLAHRRGRRDAAVARRGLMAARACSAGRERSPRTRRPATSRTRTRAFARRWGRLPADGRADARRLRPPARRGHGRGRRRDRRPGG